LRARIRQRHRPVGAHPDPAGVRSLVDPAAGSRGVDSRATIRPTPHRKSGALGFDVSCPDTDGEPEDCRAIVRIRTRFNDRLLAAGSLNRHRARNRFLRLQLTALGRRRYGDHHRQLATTVIRGPLMLRTAWTIGF
jgi:hypothetical protein